MNQSRLSSKLIAGIILALLFGVALYLRIALPYDQVFVGDWIKVTGIDAYYHMRLVDNLVHHFPHRILFDPYTFYPYGQAVAWHPFFDWLLAGIIWVIGLGSPTQHTIDVVGVYFPAILGAVTVIPVYFIGKELFNRWAGAIAAGLVTLFPSEFLGRSILGFTDHHVAEVLFSTVAIMFLILAIKAAKQRQLSYSHIRHRDWAIITKPLIYSLLTGIFLGIYILSFSGGLIFVFIIFVYFIIQFIIDHLRRQNTDYLGIIGTLSFLTASVISLPLLPETGAISLYRISLLIAFLAPGILSGISHLLASQKVKPAYYPLSLIGVALVSLAIFYAINPSLLKSMLGGGYWGWFAWRPEVTIPEGQPLLFPGGNFSFSAAWGNFTTGFFLSFISLGMLIYFIIKRGEADKTLLVVWSLFILVAALGQRRWAYYLATNVALLTGYLSWQILEFAGVKKLVARPVETPETVRKKKEKRKKARKVTGPTASRIKIALAMIVIFFLVFFPNIKPAIATASWVGFAPDDAWCESLSWLKENTPDPFGNANFYYELYEPPPSGENYKYPESAYGIMAWWDYGHLITRIAHRIPNSSPFIAGVGNVARFFSAQDEASASEIMDELGSRYVIIDYATAIAKKYVVVKSAGKSPEDFFDFYYQPQEGEFVPIQLFYPEYYRSLSARLYNFDGEAITPKSSLVISYQERISREGKIYKVITSSKSFPDYEAATAYISGQKSANYRVVGTNPFISPVPLDALEHYRLIYSSDRLILEPHTGTHPAVKIFEYLIYKR